MKKELVLIYAFIFIPIIALGQKPDKQIVEIQETLQVFQKGYAERDTSKAAEWCNTIFYDNVEILGTYSIKPDGMEWFTGKSTAVKVFQYDWIAWGDLEANLETANIHYDGDFAWVSLEATITRSPNNSRSRTAEESAGNIFNHFNELGETNDERTNKLKLAEAAYYANLILYQYEQGEEFTWPIRITGTLQKKNGKWKFRQMHFSHPNRGFPNVRF